MFWIVLGTEHRDFYMLRRNFNSKPRNFYFVLFWRQGLTLMPRLKHFSALAFCFEGYTGVCCWTVRLFFFQYLLICRISGEMLHMSWVISQATCVYNYVTTAPWTLTIILVSFCSRLCWRRWFLVDTIQNRSVLLFIWIKFCSH